MTPPLIGLTGRAGTGKDTVAGHLVELHGYHRVAFADAIKASAYAADPYVDAFGFAPGMECYRLSAIVDAVGWDAAKRQHPDVRRYLQRHGVAVRDALPGCWVTIAGRAIDAHRDAGHPVVVTDVRFPDEVAAIKARGGFMFRVCRPGHGPLDGVNGAHVSERTDTLDVDYGLWNTGPLSGAALLADQAHRLTAVRTRRRA